VAGTGKKEERSQMGQWLGMGRKKRGPRWGSGWELEERREVPDGAVAGRKKRGRDPRSCNGWEWDKGREEEIPDLAVFILSLPGFPEFPDCLCFPCIVHE
jgi:hypothetical protein